MVCMDGNMQPNPQPCILIPFHARALWDFTGKLTMARKPLGKRLSSRTVPPWARMMARQMARPKPAPPVSVLDMKAPTEAIALPQRSIKLHQRNRTPLKQLIPDRKLIRSCFNMIGNRFSGLTCADCAGSIQNGAQGSGCFLRRSHPQWPSP
jgi:hypothetical protein